MKQPIPYVSWLIALEAELAEALREAEDLGWHHLGLDAKEGRHYNRLVTWLDEVKARKGWWFDHTK